MNDEKKEKVFKAFPWTLSLILIILLGISFYIYGCKSKAIKKNYEIEMCFILADAAYREIPASTLGILANGCISADKESRGMKRAIFCEKKSKDLKFNSQGECRLYLNQK